MNFKGKSIIVTGSSAGIGKAIVECFLKHGGVVYGFSRRKDTNFADEYEDNYRQFEVDVTNHERVNQIIDEIISNDKIDVLINNAGIKQDGSMLKMSQEKWNNVINVNLNAVFNITKKVAQHMRENKAGAIINVSSISATRCAFGQSNYVSTKGAIESFTRACSAELSYHGIRVNCISPGCIKTEMWNGIREDIAAGYEQKVPLGRFGTPDEIAYPVLFLASEYASYINGEVIHINGGLLGVL